MTTLLIIHRYGELCGALQGRRPRKTRKGRLFAQGRSGAKPGANTLSDDFTSNLRDNDILSQE
ncbi:hypothetical protein PRJ_Fausto_00198 [Faustovirus]|nr:hypothetical protein PRJ_Fausto_00198 [Faustovirus]QBR99107.1 hypothetical protein [Faustovirus mariensis]